MFHQIRNQIEKNYVQRRFYRCPEGPQALLKRGIL